MIAPHYFLDISGSMTRVQKRDIFSGVQRVVMTLGHELSRIIPPDQLFITWYESEQQDYLCLPYGALAPGVLMDARAMRATFYPRAHLRLARVETHKNGGGRAKARRLGDMLAHLPHTIFSGSDTGYPPAPQSATLEKTARAGDHLLLMDLSPNPERDAALRALRHLGMRNITLVHDLIPMVAPYFVTSRTSDKFHEWLKASLTYTDLYLTDSQATRRDLQVFLEQAGSDMPLEVLPLAQDRIPRLQQAAENRDPAGAGPYALMQELAGHDGRVRQLIGTPYVLCVGKIEARKNNWRIALAWQKLAQAGQEDLPRLVFAGRVAEQSGELQHLLGHPTGGLDGYVEIIEGPSDGELELLYKHCEFTVQASLYEGWGLPVGESLSYGKTGVVSDRTSLPEVGGNLVVYCDPERVESIADAVKILLQPEKRVALEEKIAASSLRSWADVAEHLLDLVRA